MRERQGGPGTPILEPLRRPRCLRADSARSGRSEQRAETRPGVESLAATRSARCLLLGAFLRNFLEQNDFGRVRDRELHRESVEKTRARDGRISGRVVAEAEPVTAFGAQTSQRDPELVRPRI